MNVRAEPDHTPHRNDGNSGKNIWTAIVLAGDRPGGDPLAKSLGLPAKALIRIDDITLLDYVVTALLGSERLDKIVILAQSSDPLLANDSSPAIRDPRVSFVPSGDGIASSILAISDTDRACFPLVVVTADNPLLTTGRVDDFLAGSVLSDLSIGVGERRIVEQTYPNTRRTWLKFRGGQYSGANMFALRTNRCRPALKHWAAIEQDRKKGLKLIASFGPWLMLRVLARTLTFAEALDRAGRKLGLTVQHVVLDSEAPIDVDKPDDLELVKKIMAARKTQTIDETV